VSEGALVAGVELGGTKCIALLARGRDIVERVNLPTADPATTLAAAAAAIARWRDGGAAVEALGIASFGPIDTDPVSPGYGRLATTPKPGWSGADVLGALACGTAGPVRIDTDVNAAALAEGRWGAARGARVHAYLTVGTGIGGALVIDGRPLRGRWHSEMGHMPVGGSEGFAGVCPYHGACLEGVASGPAIAGRTGRPAEALAVDDPVWGVVAEALAELVIALFLIAAPERVIVGGGVGLGAPALLPHLREATRRRLADYPLPLDAETAAAIIGPPALGADAGPLGAAALALAALEDG
jgi:fructokinase